MLFPNTLKENEFIRLVAIRRDKTGNPVATKVQFVQSFDEYAAFVFKYRYTHDVYNQLATNRGCENGTKSTQRQRKVLYLDFDSKDYPQYQDAQDFTKMIKDKLPKLFLHTCVASGNGFHYYISIKPTCKIDEVTAINQELVALVGADTKATLPTQIARVPCTFNHKANGIYDYENRENWNYSKVVFNSYGKPKFQYFETSYVKKQIDRYNKNLEVVQTLEKVEWDYTVLDNYPCYLCIQKALNEGADEHQRNFWHGRIVKMLQKQGYSDGKVHEICQEYNRKCRPPKKPEIIKEDTDRFLQNDEYKLLGCYESFPVENKHREIVEEYCDKAHCGTYHNGAKISIQGGEAARINNKILTNKDLTDTKITGYGYLIMTIMDVYSNNCGRKGFRVKNLKDILYSSIKKRYCISERSLPKWLKELEKKNWIEIVPDKKSDKFDDCRLKLTRRLKEFQQGSIEFYFSIAGALIDGRISPQEYILFIMLVRNIYKKQPCTYEQLAKDFYNSDDPNHKANIRKYIKKLEKERCILIKQQPTDKGYWYNQYYIMNGETFEMLAQDNGTPYSEHEIDIIDNNVEDDVLEIKLLA